MANEKLLIKHVIKAKTTDAMHSSGYAQSQNGGNFGAVSTETFAQRRSIEEQRKFVRGYHNSRIIGSSTGVARAKTYTPPAKNTDTAGAGSGSGRFRDGARPIEKVATPIVKPMTSMVSKGFAPSRKV